MRAADSAPVILVSEADRLPGRERIEARAAAAGWELRYFDAVTEPDPAVLERTRVFVPPLPHRFGGTTRGLFGRLPALELVQLLSAGVDHVMPLVPAGVALCNAAGVRDRGVAELALGLILMQRRDLGWHTARTVAGAWERDAISPGLNGARVLIVGYGRIGAELRRHLAPFDVEVEGVATTARVAPDGTTVHALESLPALVGTADVVVLTLPLTERTRGLVDADLLARMREGSLLVNLARGAIVDTNALLAAATSGRVRAALDVTDPEPLPAAHPLRTAPGVLITSHIGGNSRYGDALETELVETQFARYLTGEPLRNLVTPAAGVPATAEAWRPPRVFPIAARPTHRTSRMPRISDRISRISPSATIAVEAKAKALAAQGRSVISFGTGEPDFATPEFVVEAAVRAARDPRNHHYSPSSGLPELRAAVAEKTLRDSRIAVEPGQVVITNGGKHAVYEAFATLVEAGDEVLLPAPYWTTYPESIALAGGRAVEVFAGAEHGYKVTPELLEAALTERTSGLVLVSPSNPTGAVYTPEELRELGEWLLATELWVLTDEIYQSICYDGVRAASILEVVPELADRTIIANGVAKTYAMTGWRVGWLVAPQHIADAAGALQSHLSSNVSNVSQHAALAALTGPQDEPARMRAAFARRREVVLDALARIDGVATPRPDGAFYVYPDVRALLGREWAGRRVDTSLDLAELLLAEIGVATVPGEAFGPSGYLRLSYALGDEDLAEGMRRLVAFLTTNGR